VAMVPEIVEEIIEKTCYIECEGRFTKGMVVIDWFEHWP
jgi:inosine-uridine nucleoside N-ribohydrolase